MFCINYRSDYDDIRRKLNGVVASPQGNCEGKKALIEFLEIYQKERPDDYYCPDNIPSGYILHLLHLKKQLESEDYEEACFIVQKILRKEPFLQPRVYHNIINILSGFFGIKGRKRG